MRTHSFARQSWPWEPAPDRSPSLALSEPPPFTLRCPPRFARSPGQADASFANPWPSEHMGGTRAATRGSNHLGQWMQLRGHLSRKTSPGHRYHGTLDLPVRDRARAMLGSALTQAGHQAFLFPQTTCFLMFSLIQDLPPPKHFSVSLMSLPYMGSPCPRPGSPCPRP